MKAIGEVLKLSSDFLKERNVPYSRRTSESLLSHVLGCKKMDLYLQFDKPLTEIELSEMRHLIKRCGKGEPLEYILGEVEFFGCRIRVDSRVLIPRPETELLAEMVAKRAQKGVLWDVCSGSGCIGISLKKACPALEVSLSDLSEEALLLAAENAKRNQADVELFQGDLLAPFAGKKADWIVCNPPYVSEVEYSQLDSSVKDYEPRMALVGGVRGTEFYERLQEQLFACLNPGGAIFFEIGSAQGEALQAIFPQGKLSSDWAGLPRFFVID